MIEECFNCSNSILYPTGALRCSFDNNPAIEPCLRHNPGSPEIYKPKYEKPIIVKQTTRIKLKPVKVSKRKPTQQGRLL